jgi:hypothetical protein
MNVNSIRTAQRILTLAMAAALLLPVSPAAQNAPGNAGKITTLIPVGNVARGATELTAQRDMPVLWGDVITTERGGRVRVRLEDGSVLSVGSQSQLRIEKHDAQAQDTQLELIYGSVRANATRIVAPGGQFKVRTKAAVAGVVGTEEYVETSRARADTTVMALGGGIVAVTSTDARFPEPVLLNPGEITTVVEGRAPSPKRPATTEELGRAFRETEADPQASLSPNSVLAGNVLQARLTARGLNTATGYSVEQQGIRVQAGALQGDAVPLTIAVAPNVPAGNYTLTVQRPEGPIRATLIVTSERLQQAALTAGGGIQMPRTQNLSATRGAKLALDGTEAQSTAGRIVSYQWRVLNTQVSSSDSVFNLNTSLLNPGSYTVQLLVTDDQGRTATQQYNLEVQAGQQPAEILQALAIAYESLQPNNFLRYFDDQRFRNYGGFAAAVEDSFRNQLESMRVFQRAVNCSVIEEQDQAICQADFELQFTKKDQQLETLDSSGNPCGGTGQPTCPPGASLGKALQTGSERTTIRYERADAGWKIVDYSATVSCPGGSSTTGVNVGSCILAAGSRATPSFLLSNVQVLSTNLPLGTSVTGSLDIVPVAGFSGSVSLSGSGQVSNASVAVQFSPPAAAPGMPVSFTVMAPSSPPMGFNAPTPFTLVITGTDSASGQTATANIAMTLEPDFTLTVTPATTAGTPTPATHNSVIALQVSIVSGAGFANPILVDFPNLPAGFSATPGTVNPGATVNFPLQVTASAPPGPAQVTVRGTSSTNLVKTDVVFLNVTSDFTVTATSSAGFIVSAGSSLPVDVTVVPINNFAAPVQVSFINLPAGYVVTPPTATVAPGATSAFSISVPAGAVTGAVPLTIQGTFASAIRTLQVNAQVQGIAPAGGCRVYVPAPSSRTIGTTTQPAQPGAPPAAQPTAPAPTSPTAPRPAPGLPAAPPSVRPVTGPGPAPSGATQPTAAQPTTAPPAATDPLAPGTQPQAPGLQGPSQQPATQPQPAGPTRRGGPHRPAALSQTPAPGTQPAPGATPPAPPPPDAPCSTTGARTAAPGAAQAGVSQTTGAAARIERGSVQLTVGSCIGLRLASGSETECDRGADIEFRSSGGTAVSIEAEGIRSLGAVALNQATTEGPLSARSAPVQQGSTYAIQLSRGKALLRVVTVRSGGLAGRPSGARPALVPGQAPAGSGATLVLALEWRIVPE